MTTLTQLIKKSPIAAAILISDSKRSLAAYCEFSKAFNQFRKNPEAVYESFDQFVAASETERSSRRNLLAAC